MSPPNPNLDISRILINCCASDVHLARICVASVRTWYPGLPVFLIKDLLGGGFSTTEIERGWNVEILDTVRSRHGWGFAKLEGLFGPATGRVLILDADTVLLGRVLEKLEREPEDFLVAGQTLPDPADDYVKTNFFDWERLRVIDPDFSYPGFCYNTGQLIARPGVLTEADFGTVVRWGSPPALRHPQIFFCGEQGVLNYVVASKCQRGEATVKSVDFGRWASDPAVDDFTLDTIANKEGYPFVLHWAGPKSPSITHMRRPDILRHYETVYYSRVRGAGIKRWVRAGRKSAAATLTDIKRKTKAMVFTRLLSQQAAGRLQKGLTYLRRVARGEQIVPNRLRFAFRKTLRRLKGGEQTGIQRKAWDILNRRKDVFFVQIGSNDGVSGDFLYPMLRRRRDWQGLFVEPVGYAFQRLQDNLRGKGAYRFENLAVSAHRGRLKFYYVSQEARSVLGGELPEYFDQLGSFNRNHIVSHLDGVLEPYIREMEVESVPLTELLERNEVRAFDLLHIDAEGYDYEILKLLDFSRYQPELIVYESRHLSQEDVRSAETFLKSNGYTVEEEKGDTFAVRTKDAADRHAYQR